MLTRLNLAVIRLPSTILQMVRQRMIQVRRMLRGLQPIRLLLTKLLLKLLKEVMVESQRS